MERTDGRGPCPSRREFLLAGGTVVTTLSLARGREPRTEPVAKDRRTIREILLRYGSELGSARYTED